MREDADQLRVYVQMTDAATGSPLGEAGVEAVSGTGERELTAVASATTGPDGLAELELPVDAWCSDLSIRAIGEAQSAVPLTRAMLDGSSSAGVAVTGPDAPAGADFALLADHLVATRRVRVDDLMSDLSSPAPDIVLGLMSPGVRARLLADLAAVLDGEGATAGDAHIVDALALRDSELVLVPFHQLERDLSDLLRPDIKPDLMPGIGWESLPWALPDDQSYRDYLRGVLVLFVHQQKLGFSADPQAFPGIVAEQLQRRFFQNFDTADRTAVPLNRLLIPIVKSILAAAKASGFGFGLPAASVPAQGTASDRAYLDVLLALAPVGTAEFANRYRLPLMEPDSVLSSPRRASHRWLSLP